MCSRLPGFDYTKPYYYMVTLRKEEAVPTFSRVVNAPAKGYLEETAFTQTFRQVIETFHHQVNCIEPIHPYVIMPDHLHVMFKLRKVEKMLTLPRIVWMFKRALEKAVEGALASAERCPTKQIEKNASPEGAVDASGRARVANRTQASQTVEGETSLRAGVCLACDCADNRKYPHLFKDEWHEWIVMKRGQLDAFWQYIEENPKRRWVRLQNARYFQKVREISFLGRKWYAYGNVALLTLPIIEAFQCSRSWKEGGEAWNRALARAMRIGPGGAGISTFMSPCEKVCGRALGKAGGAWIILSPEGFSERWHPSRRFEPFCASGRMLFLSLYPAMMRKPTKEELYARCHGMGDCVRVLENQGVVYAPCVRCEEAPRPS